MKLLLDRVTANSSLKYADSQVLCLYVDVLIIAVMSTYRYVNTSLCRYDNTSLCSHVVMSIAKIFV